MASQAALEIILQARDEASNVMEQASGALGGVGKVAGGIVAGGLAAAGAAVAGVAAKAFSFSQTTDQAMRLFQAQVGASAEEMADFRTQALDVFEAGWGENVEDIAGAMAGVNQVLGETGDALEDSTRRALVLRDTFGIEVQEGVSIAGAAIKSGLVDNSEAAFDLITKGFQEGLNQAGDFGDTVMEYSSDFERLGFTSEEVLGVLNAGLEEGAYNTDVISDGIREFGIRFGAAEESAGQALDAIGLNSEELYAQYEAGEITVADAMETITGALQDVDSQTLQAQAGAALFGSKWEDIGGDVFMAAGQAQDAIGDMGGATDEAGEALEQGITPALDRLWRTVQTNLAPLGDVMGDLVDQAIPYIEQLATWLSENVPDAIDWLSTKWREVWPQVQATLQATWAFVQPIFAALDKALFIFKGTLQASGDPIESFRIALLNMATALGVPIEKARAMSHTIANVFNSIKTVVTNILGTVTPFIQEQVGWIVGWFEENWPLIQETVETVLKAAQDVIEAVLKAVRKFWKKHGEKIKGIVESVWKIISTVIETVIRTIFGVIKAVMQLITGDWEGAWGTIRDIGRRIWNAIKTIVSEAINAVRDTLSIVLDEIEELWDSIWGSIDDIASDKWEEIESTVSDGVQNAKTAISDKVQAFKDAGKAILQGAIDGVEDKAGDLKEEVEDAVSSAKGAVGDFYESFKGAAKDLIQGMIDGFGAMAGDLWDAAWSIAKSALSAIKQALGIGSPSQAAIDIAENVMGSMASGFKAFGELPAQELSAQMRHVIQAPVGAGAVAGGGGASYVIHNSFGPGSVRSYDDIEEIARRQEEILNIRGVRSWEV